MSKLMKIVSLILVVCMLTVVLSTISNAEKFEFGKIDTDSVTKNASDDSGAAESINRIVGMVLTIVQVIGMGVAVIMLIVLAIKYISASPGDKADIKKHAVVYVVGAIVLFAASGLLQIVKNFASAISGTTKAA